MARSRRDQARADAAEARKYRRAAEEALNQLDWCVSYLHSIRKSRIARAIEKNRSLIRRRMNRTDD